jgi:hypothetical protein
MQGFTAHKSPYDEPVVCSPSGLLSWFKRLRESIPKLRCINSDYQPLRLADSQEPSLDEEIFESIKSRHRQCIRSYVGTGAPSLVVIVSCLMSTSTAALIIISALPQTWTMPLGRLTSANPHDHIEEAAMFLGSFESNEGAWTLLHTQRYSLQYLAAKWTFDTSQISWRSRAHLGLPRNNPMFTMTCKEVFQTFYFPKLRYSTLHHDERDWHSGSIRVWVDTEWAFTEKGDGLSKFTSIAIAPSISTSEADCIIREICLRKAVVISGEIWERQHCHPGGCVQNNVCQATGRCESRTKQRAGCPVFNILMNRA